MLERGEDQIVLVVKVTTFLLTILFSMLSFQ
jgi:hypothetical protein